MAEEDILIPVIKRTIGFITGSGVDRELYHLLHGVNLHFDHEVKDQSGPIGVVHEHAVGFYGPDSDSTKVVVIPRHAGSPTRLWRPPVEMVRQRGYEANIWLMHKLGVQAIYATSAVGAMDKYTPMGDKPPGHFIIPDKYVRGLAASQHSFGSAAPVTHTRMDKPFDADLRGRLWAAAEKARHKALPGGVYIYNGGDAFETPSEIRMLEAMTRELAHPFMHRLVGMTVVPEVQLAHQAGIPYAALCCNVNYAEGRFPGEVSHEQTLKVMKDTEPMIVNILGKVLESYYPAQTQKK